MKLKFILRLAAGLCLTAGVLDPPAVVADLLVYDFMDYPAGSTLVGTGGASVGQNGGLGWAGGWGPASGFTHFTNQSASLAVPGLPAYPTAGGSVAAALPPSSSDNVRRSLDLVATNRELWFSFIMATPGRYGASFGLEAYDRAFWIFNGQFDIEISPYAAGTGQSNYWALAQQQNPNGRLVQPGIPTLLVMQMSNASPVLHTFRLYVNPAAGSNPLVPDATWVVNNVQLDRLVEFFYVTDNNSTNLTHHRFDELRVGTSFTDINPPNSCVRIETPSNLVVSCSMPTGALVNFNLTATNLCNPTNAVLLSSTRSSGSVFPVGTTMVDCMAQSQVGNLTVTNYASFLVTVLSNCPPATNCVAIYCPSNFVTMSEGTNSVVVDYSVTASNLCTGQLLPVTCLPPSGSLFPPGTNAVTCQVVANQETNTCSFLVIVTPQFCCAGKAWELSPPSGPGFRQGHVLASDPKPGRVMMFGGHDGGSLKGDTWLWNGSSWSATAAFGPPDRQLAAVAYDSKRSRVVLFGGQGSSGLLGDTWEWDGFAWQPINAGGPPPRHSHGMAFDPVRERVVLYGGLSDSGPLNDSWEFNGLAWVAMTSGVTNPGPRFGHSMAWDGGHVILFGGFSQGQVRHDTWTWLGDHWTQVADSGPAARQYQAMAFDDACGKVVLFGGGLSVTNLAFGDTWEWDRTAWILKSSSAPTARWQHAMAHGSVYGETVLFGGEPPGQIGDGDTWVRRRDQTPPGILSVSSECNENTICLKFSEALDPVSSQTPSNYSIPGGPAVLSVFPGLTADSVCLNLSGPILAGSTNTLASSNILDLCGNPGSAVTPFTCDACAHGSAGTGFWLTFPGNDAPDPADPPHPQLFVTGESGTSVTVCSLGLAPPFLATYTITASRVVAIALPSDADLGASSDQIQNKGVRVTATSKVNVYGLNHVANSSDAYLGLSTNSLGQAYLVLTYQNLSNTVPELNTVQFAVVATENGTQVTITPTATVGSHLVGVPFTVTLNQGQTYQLCRTNPDPADLTGTLLVANHPVAVFGSHPCASIPNGQVAFCNHLVEQLFPSQSGGTNFATIPLRGRRNGDTFRFMALYDGTTIMTNAVVIPSVRNQGQFHEVRLAAPAHITSDKPILVAQYANSSDFDIVDYSDPFMVMIPPTVMFAPSYVVETPPVGFATNFINVVAPFGSAGQIILDGTAIPAGSYTAIGASGFLGSGVKVAPGVHTIYSANGQSFGVIVYGWDLYDAYGYPGGICPSLKRTQPNCPASMQIEAGDDCTAAVPDFPVAGLTISRTQTPAAGSRVGIGTFTVTNLIVDSFGGVQTCFATLTVLPAAVPVLQCPPNIITNCTTGGGVAVSYAPFLCNSNFIVSCQPPSGHFFLPGTNTVVCTASNGITTVSCGFSVTVVCPRLTVESSANGYRLTFPAGGELLQATNLVGPYLIIPGATSPYPLPLNRPMQFFRWRSAP